MTRFEDGKYNLRSVYFSSGWYFFIWMVLSYGLSTKPMTWNVYRDKERESNVQTIEEVMQLMEVPVSVG